MEKEKGSQREEGARSRGRRHPRRRRRIRQDEKGDRSKQKEVI